ncbi:hypothetical protein SRS16CHR_00155 [Variovorax sp. SRS16]|uniref:hypothetical protein n=1 Tax=Variovorax sp. SRS16 TaxID=282217 RepID=UPI001316C407|nr:hypothetical protein [Variovorax sp. SRS16]VTU12916.1 hypothetical protein SRS16CHR_00155 [Variovorax sp. SRS16]
MTDETEAPSPIQQATLWSDELWTARVIKNEDDDGWAVSMTRQGDPEPALVGPWTMGRDKKNPKPLDAPAFHTLVKTASEVLRRHEQQLHARLNRSVSVGAGSERIRVSLRIVPDEDNPHAVLSALDELGAELGEARVRPDFRLSADSAAAWIESGFQKPR